MRATNEAVLMIEPRPRACMCGSAALQHRYTEVRFTSCTRRHASRPVTRIESSSGGEMPALLNATSTEPYVSLAAANSASTPSGSVTSVRTNSPPSSAATSGPAGVGDAGPQDHPAELGRALRPALLVEVGDHHVGALGGEPAGRRQPDPRAPTRDHRDPAFDPALSFHHWYVPCFLCSSVT